MDNTQFRIVIRQAKGPPQNDRQPGDVDLPMIGFVYRGLDAEKPHVIKGVTEDEILEKAKVWADEVVAQERAAQEEHVYVYDPMTNVVVETT